MPLNANDLGNRAIRNFGRDESVVTAIIKEPYDGQRANNVSQLNFTRRIPWAVVEMGIVINTAACAFR